MKAVIVEIEGKYAVALNKKGQFIKTRNNNNCKIGSEIDLPTNANLNINSLTKIASMAAAVLLVVGISCGAYSYSKPYSYVDVDINPSIEITTNVFDRIIEIKAMNTDGEKVLSEGSYKNKDIKDGIENIIESAVDKGYIRSTYENAIMFTIASKNDGKASKLQEDVNSAAVSQLKTAKLDSEILVEKMAIQEHDNLEQEAGKLNISTGKMQLLERLQKADPQIKIDDYKGTPIRDIIKIIKEDKKEEAAAKKVNKDNNGNKGNEKVKKDNKGAKSPKKDAVEVKSDDLNKDTAGSESDISAHKKAGNDNKKNDSDDVKKGNGNIKKPDKDKDADKNIDKKSGGNESSDRSSDTISIDTSDKIKDNGNDRDKNNKK